MFERYTERARRVLFFARYEASQLGSISIETEHMLLGLVREGKGLTSRLFASANVSLSDIRRQVEGRTVFREKVSTSVEIPFSPETKRVLQFAANEADRLEHSYIGTEHLLLGLLREERSVAAAILQEAGLSLDEVRGHIKSLVGAGFHEHVDRQSDPDETHPDHPLGRWPVPLYIPSTVVHISVNRYPRKGEPQLSVGPHHWLVVDAPLRYLVARLHGVRDEQVKLPAGAVPMLDVSPTLDVSLVLPTDRTETQTAESIVLAAIEQQLRLRITREATPDGDVVTVTTVDQ